jgi:hypothetical protein
MEWHGLTTREWATVFYASVIVVLCIALPSWRAALAPVIRTFFNWKIQATIFALLAWTAVVLYVGSLVGAWNTDLLKDAIAWLLVSGLSTLLSTVDAPKKGHFFRRLVLSAISAGALMQFVLNLHTFNIVIELILQPFVIFLVVLSAVAHMKPDTVRVGKLVDGLLGIVGIWIVIATVRGLVNSWRGVDPKETGLAFAFSIWLPLAMIPFVYVVALGQTYGKIFTLSSFRNDDKKPPLRVRAAIVYGLGGNLREVNDLPQFGTYSLICRSRGFREALGHVRNYDRERQRRINEKQLEEDRLEWYAGVEGRRADGTLLDRREFKETTEALRWLSTCHMGHYNNRGRYRKDLLDVLGNFERQGLPADHGITMRVNKDGQRWYAWRRTVTGYVFAIGASEGTPSQWLYEGEEPPSGFPGQDPSWGDGPYQTPPNWE